MCVFFANLLLDRSLAKFTKLERKKFYTSVCSALPQLNLIDFNEMRVKIHNSYINWNTTTTIAIKRNHQWNATADCVTCRQSKPIASSRRNRNRQRVLCPISIPSFWLPASNSQPSLPMPHSLIYSHFLFIYFLFAFFAYLNLIFLVLSFTFVAAFKCFILIDELHMGFVVA